MTLHDSFLDPPSQIQNPIIKRPFGNPKSTEFIIINSDDSDSDSSLPSIAEIFNRDPIVKHESISRITTSHTTMITRIDNSSTPSSSIIRNSREKVPNPKSKDILQKERYISMRYY
jgi:hypothetical protein